MAYSYAKNNVAAVIFRYKCEKIDHSRIAFLFAQLENLSKMYTPQHTKL